MTNLETIIGNLTISFENSLILTANPKLGALTLLVMSPSYMFPS